jgi:hypothetical protein
MLAALNCEDTDADLGILKDGAKELLPRPEGLLCVLAFRDVFRKRGDQVWFSRGVPKHSEPRPGEDIVAVTMDEVLFPFIAVTFALLEIRITLRPAGTIVGMNHLFPVLKVAHFLFRVTQHVLKSAVAKGFSAFNAEKADADLGIIEDGAEELFVQPQASMDSFAHGSSL